MCHRSNDSLEQETGTQANFFDEKIDKKII